MVVYLTFAAIVSIIAIGPAAFGFIMMTRYYLKERYQHALYMMLGWFFSMLTSIFYALSILFLLKPLYLVGSYLLIPTVFLYVLLFDSITRESVDPIKIGIFAVLFSIFVFLSLDPNAVIISNYPSGEPGVFLGGSFRIAMVIGILPAGLLFLYYGIMTYRKAPKGLKSYASFFLLGVIIYVFVPVFLVAFSIPLIIPGIQLLSMTVGSLLLAVAFAIQPKLAFILPFRVLKLSVVETNGGISLFTHTWSKMDEFVDEQLFSGMLQAISQILHETLKRGDLSEIHVEGAVLLIRRSEKYPVACILIATGSTRSLRKALDSFAEQFFKEYSHYFLELDNPDTFDLENYAGAAALVEDRFSFVPEFK